MVINSSSTPILALTVAFYLVQPLLDQHFVINQGRPKICLVLTIVLSGCNLLPYRLYQKVAPSPHFLMLWTHCTGHDLSSIFSCSVCRRRRLRKTIRAFQFPRIVIFTLSALVMAFNDTLAAGRYANFRLRTQ